MTTVARATRVAIATGLYLVVHACTSVEGGAVELSWKLRPASSSLPDRFVECASGKEGTGPVTRIRLDWEVIGQRSGFASWCCDDNQAVTGFDLPEGDALLTITPECAEFGTPERCDSPTRRADPVTYTAPAVVQRHVTLGNTVTLGAVELVLQVSDCSPQSPCICAP